MLAARCLPGVRLTLGKEKDENGRWQNSGACQAAKEMGAEHEPCDITVIGVCFFYDCFWCLACAPVTIPQNRNQCTKYVTPLKRMSITFSVKFPSLLFRRIIIHHNEISCKSYDMVIKFIMRVLEIGHRSRWQIEIKMMN